MKECARSGCNKVGTNVCGGCSKEVCCRAACQKADWIIHK